MKTSYALRGAFAVALASTLACGSRSSSPGFTGAADDAGADRAADAGSVVAEAGSLVSDDAHDDESILGFGDANAVSSDAAEPTSNVLMLTIRDFQFYDFGASTPDTTNPDFENELGSDPGIVATTLGSDKKPVYAKATGMTLTTHGKQFFDQWYNDVPGTNINVQYPLTLTQTATGTWSYDSLVTGVPVDTSDPTSTKMFFPIDDGTKYATSFGDQGQEHNYSFTTELHTVFTYRGGETFSFSGDDDVFVFIDSKLAIDLGGVHTREQASVQLDSLGLAKGQQYPLDLFHAERHTVQSNLSFTTELYLQPPPLQ
jgi:fibro-slime domain-containing protein